MSFISQQQQTNRPGATIAVIGIHALLGAGLVFGLGGAVKDIIEDRRIIGVNVDPVEPPPPSPKEQPDMKAKPIDSIIYTPPIDPIVPRPGPTIGSTTKPAETPHVTPSVPASGGGLGGIIETLPHITVAEPIGAIPRNDSSRWVRTSDYRSRWRRENMAGAASYRLGVGSDGRVQNCAITRSSGHTALDEATCSLVTRRARFNPARNSADERVAGSYNGSILWQLPE